MNTPSSLNVLHRSVAFCMAAVITLGLLGGIDQLAQLPQEAGSWAALTTPAQRG